MAGLLDVQNSGAKRFRQLLSGTEAVVAPGAYDALSARLIESAGFPTVYMTGFGVSASMLGRPDVGLTTMSEMVDSARRMVQAVSVPVIADADTGYGNALNVVRTVREYEAAGVAGIQLEDQMAPKRCGHMTGRLLVAAAEMEGKIRAAVTARRSSDLVIIARTDAREVEGIDHAIERARRYRDAGADMLFVEAPQTIGEVETIARELAGTPLLFNWAEGGKTPPISLHELQELGFRLVIFPVGALLAATAAVQRILDVIKADGTPQRGLDAVTPFRDFLELIGLPEIDEMGKRFA
ncbi:MAG: isocitrate lyase/PEP mutase family protein [Nitrolancea sp.]